LAIGWTGHGRVYPWAGLTVAGLVMGWAGNRPG
jgi:hypothetical protein